MLPPWHESPSDLEKQPPPQPARPVSPQTDGRAAGIMVAVVALLGDLALYGIGRGARGEIPELLMTLVVAWYTSGLGLLAVWLGLGGGPVYLRLLVAAIPGAILILLLDEGRWHVEAFAGLSVFLVAVAVPFGVLRMFGFELRILRPYETATDVDQELGRGQFSLRQMFGWTVAASLVASISRFIEFPRREWVAFSVTPAVFSLISLAAVCAALMPRNGGVGRWVIPLCVSTMLLTCGTAVALAGMPRGDSSPLFYLAAASVLHVLLIFGVLMIFRTMDYRLVRRASAPITTAAASDPVPRVVTPPDQSPQA